MHYSIIFCQSLGQALIVVTNGRDTISENRVKTNKAVLKSYVMKLLEGGFTVGVTSV